MTGKCYYVTTIGDWKRHAGAFANSHWLLLETELSTNEKSLPSGNPDESMPLSMEQLSDTARIVVLIEADEGTHGLLEDNASFAALPQPLSSKPIPAVLEPVLGGHGVPAGASTFEVAEIISRSHPLLRHRVF